MSHLLHRRRKPLPAHAARILLTVFTCALASMAGAQDQPASGEPAQPIEVASLLPDDEQIRGATIDERLRSTVAQLADPSYHVREAATRALLEQSIDLAQICAVLSETDLHPEQRRRLVSILQRQILTAPRGALGISMVWRQSQPGRPGHVEVRELIPNLPAAEVLCVGDRITHVNGRELYFQSDLVVLVQSMQPGESAPLIVQQARRDKQGDLVHDADGQAIYETKHITLRLGSADLLIDPQTGLPTSPGSVQMKRRNDAAEAARRYMPSLRVIEIQDDIQAPFPTDAANISPLDEQIDSHPAVRLILQQQNLIAEGRLELTDSLQQAWARQLEAVLTHARQRDLSNEHRLFLHNVALRIAELIDR